MNQNAVAAGIMAFNAATPLFPLFKGRNRREADPETEELEARAISPIILPAMAATSNMLAMTPFFNKPRGGRRELSDELFSRDPEVEDFQDLTARANWDNIKFGIGAASQVTPLIAKYAQTFRVPKREISDELFSREPEDWAGLAEGVSKREPHLHGKGKKGKKGKTGKKGKKSRS